MISMSTLKKSFATEIVKSKNSFALWLTILAAGYPTTLLLLVYAFHWGIDMPVAEENPWNNFIRKSVNAFSFVFLPMFIVLLTALIMNIEHKSNTWKQLFVLPISKANIFISKYLLLITMILLFYLIFIMLILLYGLLLNIWNSGYHFLDYKAPLSNLIISLSFSFISVLPILSIHFWLSFRIKNLLISCLIGLCGTVTAAALFSSSWHHPPLFPYEFPFFMIRKHQNDFDDLILNFQLPGIIYFLVISFFSYSDFTKKFKG